MNKRIRIAIAAATIVGGFTMTQAGSASAAHCFEDDPTEEMTPGFSYFGTDHVKEEAHASEGGNPGPHAGTPGASNCRNGATGTDPSTRAPGQNKP